MDAIFQPRLRIAVVTTRELATRAGRPGILLDVIQTLERRHDVRIFRLQSITELGGLAAVAGAALTWLRSLICGRPLPLQCLLYAVPKECARVDAEIRQGRFDAVYLDTVRCQILLRRLHRSRPRPHIVTDFDDLMSRRAKHLVNGHMPLLLGHAGSSFPRCLQPLIEQPLARLVTRYEAITLKHAEREAVDHSDAVVLLSTLERQLFKARLPYRHRLQVQAIPPAVAVRAAPWPRHKVLRFIFVGSDELLQNRRCIEFLLGRWQLLRPVTPLHIYGRQTRTFDWVAGVHWHGFVPDLADIYQPGSIALVPAQVAGGIKTKVAEAWAWGCPVLGNAQAFEGLNISGYPSALPEQHWDPLLVEPGLYREVWASAARLGQQFARRNLSVEAFSYAWETIMRPLSDANAALLQPGNIEAGEAD